MSATDSTYGGDFRQLSEMGRPYTTKTGQPGVWTQSVPQINGQFGFEAVFGTDGLEAGQDEVWTWFQMYATQLYLAMYRKDNVSALPGATTQTGTGTFDLGGIFL